MPKTSDLKTRALAFHKKLKGKIALQPKTKIKTKVDLSLAYSPGVAEPCREIARDPAKVYEYCWTANTILIATDGTAVLGLGDIGPEAALPVMEGKSLLFKEFGGVDCVPLCLATKDADEIVNILAKVLPAYGGINLEDIAAPRCFEIEEKLKKMFPTKPIFHDDQHGTAIVVLAALINAAKVTKRDPKKVRVVINGAGAAGIATAKLLRSFGIGDVTLCDTAGAIYCGRPDNMNEIKTGIACAVGMPQRRGSLADVLAGADIFIGVSKKDALTPAMVASMVPRPIIFALANPDPEILPAAAKQAGAAVVGTGRSDFPNQINNILAFPGIFRAALDARTQITDEMKLAAALAIAKSVPRPTADKVVPDPFDRSVAKKVAAAVKKIAKKN